jgi:hypothetical protein
MQRWRLSLRTGILPGRAKNKKLKAVVAFAVIITAMLASPLWAQVDFFIDSTVATSGNGSAASPWKSFSDINWATINADATAGQDVNINLKRGDVWNESFNWGASGLAGHPITLQAYGSGAPPEINGAVPIPGSASWTELGSSNVYSTNLFVTSPTFTTFNNGIWGNKVASASAIANKYDWSYDSVSKAYSVYCPAGQDPTTYYNNIAPLTVGVNSGLVNTNNKSYLTISGLKIDNFDSSGIQISPGSNNVTVAYSLIDGKNSPSSNITGISEQNGSANGINIYNTDIVRNQTAIATTGNAHVDIQNSAAYANKFLALLAGGTATTYDYNAFFGNYGGLTRVDVNVNGPGTAGSNNLSSITPPALVNVAAYKPYVALEIDDVIQSYQTRINQIVSLAQSKGITLTLGVEAAKLPSSSFLTSWIQSGEEIAAHGYSHQYYNQPNVININYTGTGTDCRLTVNNNILTTTVTGGPGGQNLSIDLTNASYDQISKLVAYINSVPGYSCTKVSTAEDTCHSYTLATSTDLNIKQATPQILAIDPTKLKTDEASQAKSILNNILAPYGKSVTDYIFPGNYEDAQYQAILKAQGYLGARGAPNGPSETLGTTGINVFGMLTTDINNFHGMSQAAIQGAIASAVMKSELWGEPLMMYFHTDSGMTDTEIGWIVDAMKLYGIPCDMATITDYIRSGENIKGDYYVKAPDLNLDFELTSLSPLIDKGDNLGLTQDILGNPVPSMNGPDIGAFEVVPVPPSIILLGSGLLGVIIFPRRKRNPVKA